MLGIAICAATTRVERFRQTAALPAPTTHYVLPVSGCRYTAAPGSYLYIAGPSFSYTVSKYDVAGISYTTVASPGILYLDRAAEASVQVENNSLLLVARDVYLLNSRLLTLWSDEVIQQECEFPSLRMEAVRSRVAELSLSPNYRYELASTAPCQLTNSILRCIVGQEAPDQFDIALRADNADHSVSGQQVVTVVSLPNDISRLQAFRYVPRDLQFQVVLESQQIVTPIGCAVGGDYFQSEESNTIIYHYTQLKRTLNGFFYFYGKELVNSNLERLSDAGVTEIRCRRQPKTYHFPLIDQPFTLKMAVGTVGALQLFSDDPSHYDCTIETAGLTGLQCAMDRMDLKCNATDTGTATAELVITLDVDVIIRLTVKIEVIPRLSVSPTCQVAVAAGKLAFVFPTLMNPVKQYRIVENNGKNCQAYSTYLLCNFTRDQDAILLVVEVLDLLENLYNTTLRCTIYYVDEDVGYVGYEYPAIRGDFKEFPGEDYYVSCETEQAFEWEYVWMSCILVLEVLLICIQIATIVLVFLVGA